MHEQRHGESDGERERERIRIFRTRESERFYLFLSLIVGAISLFEIVENYHRDQTIIDKFVRTREAEIARQV